MSIENKYMGKNGKLKWRYILLIILATPPYSSIAYSGRRGTQ